MIVLVHHGDAVGPDVDPMRPLSSFGRGATERLASAAAEQGVRPDVVWHSGKLRARQTAEAFWKACNPFAEFGALRGLQPDDPPGWIRDVLLLDARSILVAGHMPHLPRLLTLMLTGRDEWTAIGFPQHGCVALEREGNLWKEVWRLR